MSATSDLTRARFISQQVLEERDRQNQQWGERNPNFLEWISVAAAELGEAATEANKAYSAREDADYSYFLITLRRELIQVAAVAIAAIESLDGNELANHGHLPFTSPRRVNEIERERGRR